MGAVTAEMRRLVEEQKLGFIATVCPDGTPNLSPKGTTAILDDDHLIFADIHSPGTIANLRTNPAIEINVVDALTRKGFRFKGAARIVEDGPELEALLDFYRQRGSTSQKRCVVVMKIEKAAPLISPAYDDGSSEAKVVANWRAYWGELWQQRAMEDPPTAKPPREAYPVAIFQDRYGGVYSKGAWIAVANADEQVEGVSRAQWLLASGAFGGDMEAIEFWQAPPDWIATGTTRDSAVENLIWGKH